MCLHLMIRYCSLNFHTFCRSTLVSKCKHRFCVQIFDWIDRSSVATSKPIVTRLHSNGIVLLPCRSVWYHMSQRRWIRWHESIIGKSLPTAFTDFFYCSDTFSSRRKQGCRNTERIHAYWMIMILFPLPYSPTISDLATDKSNHHQKPSKHFTRRFVPESKTIIKH